MAWARGVARLTRLPVTEKTAGSNPVGPAICFLGYRSSGRYFYLLICPTVIFLKFSLVIPKPVFRIICKAESPLAK
jgi:hypothetical protein